MSRAAVPPSPQEVHRKLSIHSAARQASKKAPHSAPPVSGTESDSDSFPAPDPPALSHSASGSSGAIFAASLSQPPLDSIAERQAGTGEESEDDEDEAEEVEGAKPKSRKSNDDSVIKTGYLWKKGERRKTWKKRWFVLRSAHLAYYKSSAEYQLSRLVELSEVHTCTAITLEKHENTFGIVSPTRTFYLQAKTQPEVQQWVQAINEAREVLQQVSTEGSTSSAVPIPIPTSTRAPPPTSSPPFPFHSSQGPGITSSESEDGSPSTRPYLGQYVPTKPQGASQKEGPKPLLSGYLMKCGSKRRTWHHRWFVLSGDTLAYSRSHMDSKTHRQIPLSSIIDALDIEVPRHPSGPGAAVPSHFHHPSANSTARADPTRSTTFKIVTTKRTLLLCAPSEEEEIKWLSAIRALIVRRSEAGVVPGDSKLPGSTSGGNTSEQGGVGASKSKRDGFARRLSLSGPGHVVVSPSSGADEGREGIQGVKQ